MENEYAAYGTLLHEAIWNDDVFAKLESNKDKKMIRAIREEHVLPYQTLKYFHEIKLPIYSEDHGELLTEGTADFLVISADGKSASLKDWKFGGYELTEAKDNAQIHAYVCGVFQQFPKLEKVYALIVQPIFGMCDYQKQHCFTRAELPDMLKRIAKSIDRAKSAEPADANPTSENCRYCNKFACPAYRQRMDTNLAIMGFSPETLSIPEQEMTIEYADKLLVAEKEITAIMKAKSDIAKKLILDNDGSIIPYKRSKGGYDVQTVIMYQGFVELLYRNHVVTSLFASDVCENDVFEYNMGKIVKHEINFKEDRGKEYLYYAHFALVNGDTVDTVMTIEEINRIRDRSKGYQMAIKYQSDNPWLSDYKEMAKKTVVRRGIKTLPIWGDAKINQIVDISDEDYIVKPEEPVTPPAQFDAFMQNLPPDTETIDTTATESAPATENPANGELFNKDSAQ